MNELAFWGAAIVVFLAKIINLHDANAQDFWVEISSQIENGLPARLLCLPRFLSYAIALFTVTGVVSERSDFVGLNCVRNNLGPTSLEGG